jgi:hypothetical protein
MNEKYCKQKEQSYKRSQLIIPAAMFGRRIIFKLNHLVNKFCLFVFPNSINKCRL